MFRLRGILSIAILLILPALLVGQTPDKRTFEVATIKTAEPLNLQAMAAGQVPHLGMNVQGTRVDIGYMSMSDLIVTAYKTKPNQIAGPDWLKTERFNILAKMPDGATNDDVPVMLQALLADRFGLKTHKEMRDDSIYALVVAKGGSKLKEAPPDAEEVAPDEATNNPQATPQFKIDRRANVATVSAGQRGTVKMSMSPDGHMHLEMSKMSMSDFAQQLTPFVDRPVFDMTELRGNYQVALELTMDAMFALARAQGMSIPAIPAGRGAIPGAPGGGAGGAAEASDPSGANTVFTSVQQLGLRLEPRKLPLEYIIIDHLDKTSTEN